MTTIETSDKRTVTNRNYSELSDEMLYGYILATLDLGWTPTFYWKNTYRKNVHSKTHTTTVDPDELEFPDYAEQVKARNCGWLSPSKIRYMTVERDD